MDLYSVVKYQAGRGIKVLTYKNGKGKDYDLMVYSTIQ